MRLVYVLNMSSSLNKDIIIIIIILEANKQQSQGKNGNFGTSHGEKILRPGNHLLAESCVRVQVFSSRDAESGVLEISDDIS